MLNGVDITDIPYEAKLSTIVDGLEIVLTDRTTNLSGFARNTRGETMTDYVLATFPSQLKEGAVATRFTRTVRPDQDGKFQLRGLPPGEPNICVNSPGAPSGLDGVGGDGKENGVAGAPGAPGADGEDGPPPELNIRVNSPGFPPTSAS